MLYVMKLEKLHKLVEQLYMQKDPNRADWCDWLYPNHVVVVADKAQELCDRYNGNPDIAVAGALLHDIADTVMERRDPEFKPTSYDIARKLCHEAGYNDDEITIIVDDICAKHSCRDGIIPQSHEGKIMATADAWAHATTDFYLYAFNKSSPEEFEERKAWMRSHLDKDFHKKIFFDEVKEEVRPAYKILRGLLS